MAVRQFLRARFYRGAKIRFPLILPLRESCWGVPSPNPAYTAVSYTHLDVYKRQDLDTAHQRIYSRILEMCVPIYCGGEDKRKEEGTEKLVQVQNLITG